MAKLLPKYLTKLPPYKGVVVNTDGDSVIQQYSYLNIESYNWNGRLLRLIDNLPIHFMRTAITYPYFYTYQFINHGVELPSTPPFNPNYTNYMIRYPRFVINNSGDFDFLTNTPYDIVGREYTRDKGIFYGRCDAITNNFHEPTNTFTEWGDFYQSEQTTDTLTFNYTYIDPDTTSSSTRTETIYKKIITPNRFLGTEALIIVDFYGTATSFPFRPIPYIIADQEYTSDIRGIIPDETDNPINESPDPIPGIIFNDVRAADTWFDDRFNAFASIATEFNRLSIIFLIEENFLFNYGQGVGANPRWYWTQANADSRYTITISQMNAIIDLFGSGQIITQPVSTTFNTVEYVQNNLQKWVKDFYGN